MEKLIDKRLTELEQIAQVDNIQPVTPLLKLLLIINDGEFKDLMSLYGSDKFEYGENLLLKKYGSKLGDFIDSKTANNKLTERMQSLDLNLLKKIAGFDD
jgi:hypothetical protein